MTWTSGAGQSGVYVGTIKGYLVCTSYTPATTDAVITTSSKWKIALHSSALTPGTAPINWDATSLTWANTSEVYGTGWATGGIVLNVAASGGTDVVCTLTDTSGALIYDHTNDVSVASTTLSNAHGCIIYNDSCTGPTNFPDQMLVAVCFGSDYSTNNGTFGIQWSASGIFSMDLTP